MLVVIGTDYIGSYESNLTYDHDHDSPNLFLDNISFWNEDLNFKVIVWFNFHVNLSDIWVVKY